MADGRMLFLTLMCWWRDVVTPANSIDPCGSELAKIPHTIGTIKMTLNFLPLIVTQIRGAKTLTLVLVLYSCKMIR